MNVQKFIIPRYFMFKTYIKYASFKDIFFKKPCSFCSLLHNLTRKFKFMKEKFYVNQYNTIYRVNNCQ